MQSMLNLVFSVYPNPFVESVNLRFAENGRYTINVLGTTGRTPPEQ